MRYVILFLLLLTPCFANEDTLSAIDALVKNNAKDKKTVALLAGYLQDDEAAINVRERAAWALGELKIKSETPKLIEAAKHKSLLIRSAALNSLIALRAKEALPIMIDMAKSDPILTLRQRATIGLGFIGGAPAVKAIADLSLDERPEVRAASPLAMALLQSKQSDFVSILKEMAADTDTFVQQRAQMGLQLAQGRRPKVYEYLQDEDSTVRMITAYYLGKNGNRKDLVALKEAYNQEAIDDVRDELNQSIKIISSKPKPKPKPKKSTPATKK